MVVGTVPLLAAADAGPAGCGGHLRGRRRRGEEVAILPWSSQIEIVSVLLSDGGACRDLHGVIKADHFSNMALGLVAEEAIQLCVEQGSVGTEGQIHARLDQRAGPLLDSALGALAQALAAKVPPASWAIEMGRHMAAEAELVRLSKEAERYASEGLFDPFAEEVRKVASLASGKGKSYDGLGDVEERHNPAIVHGISTGVRRLDPCLRGRGWLPGQLILLLGPDGGGKSHVAISFGTAALLQGLRVHQTTLEMDQGECRARYDRSITGIGSNDFWARLPEVKGKLDEVAKRLTVLEAVDRPLTVSGLEAEVLRLPPERKPDLLIVDSGYLLSSGRSYSGDGAAQAQRNDLSDLHQRLRIMGQRLRCPVITPFQANREGLKKMSHGRAGGEIPEVITRADMADALSVSRHADIVISVNQNVHEHAGGTGRLWLDKARGGKQFEEIACRFQWDRSRVRDLQEDG